MKKADDDHVDDVNKAHKDKDVKDGDEDAEKENKSKLDKWLKRVGGRPACCAVS